MKKVFHLVLDFLNKSGKDHVPAYAASSTLFIIMSFLPFVLLLITLLRFTPFTEEILTQAALNICPDAFDASVQSLIHQMYQNVNISGYVLMIVALIWSAGKGFHSLINGLNSVYAVEDKRNWFVVRLIAILYTFIFLIILIVCLGLYILGRMIKSNLKSLLPDFADIINSVFNYRWPIILIILTLLFSLMYMFIPRTRREFRWTLPGAFFSSVGWTVFSYFFSLYVEYSTGLTLVYGSLTTIICAMLWLYTCMMMFLLGGELNTFFAKWFPAHRKKKAEAPEEAK